MKPIEPGCLCLIINAGVPENNLKQVTAIGFVVGSRIPAPGPNGLTVYTEPGEVYWEVEGDLFYRTTQDPTLRRTGFGLIRASRLIRIDGHEPEKTTEHSKESVTC